MPANPARLVEVRQALVAWATAIGLPDDLVEDIVLATYEGLINATEHAYTADPRRLDLTAGLMIDGWLLVTVRDYGRWRQPPADPGFRGRGLMMIHNLPDRAEVRPSADGTVVQMAWNTTLGWGVPRSTRRAMSSWRGARTARGAARTAGRGRARPSRSIAGPPARRPGRPADPRPDRR